MKINKTLVIAFAVLFVAGILVVVGLNRNSPIPSRAEAENSMSKSTGIGSTASTGGANFRTREKIRSQKISKEKELLIQYGESRTNQARQLAGTVISMLDEAVQMGEADQSGRRPFGRAMAGMGMGMLVINSQIGLTEEQKVKLDKIYSDYQKRQQEKTKDTVERLKKDPTPLMSLMLANDASARGEIKDKEYAQLKSKSEKALEGVGNPVGVGGFHGMGSSGSPLKDDTFVAEYKSQLNPEQRSKLDESLAAMDTANKSAPVIRLLSNDITDMPKMELEKLDAKIESAKSTKTKIEGMMGGLGGLQNFGQ